MSSRCAQESVVGIRRWQAAVAERVAPARERVRDERRRRSRAGTFSAASTSLMPIASHVSNGPSSQPKPHRIARSTSSIESATSGAIRAA